ncbi:transmembrane protein 262 [Acipenser oxyrinchus oxyrinchus]|uniref:Transmembrane protein 262 n=1 Tax=Acipenser oxyrinchus oxyrinchus TaxID=40147 RepID=A0AAD8FV44_ACIOX|nr:transmembrane protein 262 [Acipenser oxyrinchus oxyrinchus]KAK1154981.1 transmembrane protein 262 [Acipenser oxyrinchus oxyrinchus]
MVLSRLPRWTRRSLRSCPWLDSPLLAACKRRVFTVSLPKKDVYTGLSLALFLLHFGVLMSDLTLHHVAQTAERSSHRYTVTLMLSHVMSFYLSLLGSVYSLQAGARRLSAVALLSTCLNLTLFLARFSFEFVVIQYRGELY